MRPFKMSMFFQMACIGSGVLLPIYWRELGFSNVEIGFLGAISFIFGLFAPPIFGHFASKFPPDKLILASFLVVAMSGLAHAMFPSLLAQNVSQAFYQFARWGFLTLVPVGVLQMLGKKTGAEYAKYRAWGSIGFILGTTALGFLAESFGARVICFTIMITAFFASLPYLRMIRITCYPEDRVPFRSIYRDSKLSLFLCLNFCGALYFPHAFIYLTLLVKDLGATTAQVSILIALNGVIAFACFPLIGRLVDRFTGLNLFLVALAMGSVRILCYGVTDALYIFPFIQLFHVGSWVLFDTLVIRFLKTNCSPGQYPKAQALTQMTNTLAMSTGSGLMAFLLIYFDLQTTYILTAWLPLLGILPWFLLRQKTQLQA